MSRANSITSRLTLRRTSTSTAASPGPGPAEDNELRRTSTYGFERRRSSLARSAASFQKKLGTTFRSGKERSGVGSGGMKEDRGEKKTLHDRFLSLPNELHVQILCHLSIPDIISMRLASRSFHYLVRRCEGPLVRHYTKNILSNATLALYPAPAPKKARLGYLLNQHRCDIVSAHLAMRIADFVMVEILFQDPDRRRRSNFRLLEERMTRRMIPVLFALNHFFDESRERIMEQRCKIGIVGLAPALMMGGCSHSKAHCSCMRDLATEIWTVNQNDIVGKYDPAELLDYHHMFILLLSAFARQLRPPTYANRFERALRGQTRPAAKLEDIATVFVLGGLQQVQKILAHRTYANRRKALDVFIKGLSPTESVRWKENWRSMLGTDEITLEQVNYAMKCVPEMQHIWTPTAQQLLLSRGTIKDVGEIMSVGEVISDLAGYDIVHGTPPVREDGVGEEDEGEEGEDNAEDDPEEGGDQDGVPTRLDGSAGDRALTRRIRLMSLGPLGGRGNPVTN